MSETTPRLIDLAREVSDADEAWCDAGTPLLGPVYERFANARAAFDLAADSDHAFDVVCVADDVRDDVLSEVAEWLETHDTAVFYAFRQRFAPDEARALAARAREDG